MIWDTVVIGAGISGLNAAHLLHKQGLKVLVLEGRDRIAGRLALYKHPSVGYVELGGAYFGKTQTAVLGLIEELGLELYKVRGDLKSTMVFKNSTMHYDSGMPSFWNPLVYLDLNNALKKLDYMSKEIPIESPWSHPQAEKWDNMSVSQYMDQTTWTKETNFIGKLCAEVPYIADPADISLLYLLWELHCLGGLRASTSIQDGLQEMKIIGGSGTICEKLAELLPKESLQLNKWVKEIRQTGNDENSVVDVVLKDETVVQTKKVICAVAITSLVNIQFDPPLPEGLKQYSSIKCKAHAFKTFMFYDKQFWRDQGINGELVSEKGIISYAIDDTKHDGSFPCIMGFIDTRKACEYKQLGKEERKNAICTQYANEYGLQEFKYPTYYVEKDWKDEKETECAGCCVWSLPPGALTKVKRLPESQHGSVHFAGTEISLTMRGYMDGAVRSSIHSASEILRAFDMKVPMETCYQHKLKENIEYMPMDLIEQYLPNVPQFILFIGTIILAVLGATLAYLL